MPMDQLVNIALAVAIIVVQVLLIKLTLWLYKRWKFSLTRFTLRKAIPLKIKDYEVLNVHKQGVLFLVIYRLLRIIVVLIQLLVSVPLMFYVFPETEKFAFIILGYIWNPLKDLFWSVVGYLPNLFKIIVIVVLIHYLVRL